MYSGFKSMARLFLLSVLATMAVVPEPIKGASTIPPSGQPAKTIGSISFLGNVAKCASANGLVLMDHTVLLFFPLGLFIKLWSLPVGGIYVSPTPRSFFIFLA